MDGTNQDELLDAQLRDAAPYIDDAGFTARVMKGMHPRRRALRTTRAVVLIFMTFVASMIDRKSVV